jgi:hypothetical protein
MDGRRTRLAQVMAEALRFEGGTSTDDEIGAEQSLERNDDTLPGEFAEWALEGSPRRLNEPSGRYVLAAQAGGVSMSFHPGGIDEKPLREGSFELV